MAKLSVSGLALDVTTVVGIIKDVASAVELAAPGFKTLLEAAMSTFSITDQDTIEKAYHERMGQTDADHLETQDELQEKAGEAGAPSQSASGEPQEGTVEG